MSKKNLSNQENILDERVHLSSASLFHRFDDIPQFVGRYLREHIGMVEDKETHEKKEGVIGYDFVNDDGEEVILSNSHAITKSLNTEVGGKLAKEIPGIFDITFKGKITNSQGKPFNRFDVFFTPDK